MGPDEPVYLKKELAEKAKLHLNASVQPYGRGGQYRFLHGLAYIAQLTSEWEHDSEFRYLPYKATGKIHSTDLDSSYTDSDEILVTIYSERKMGHKDSYIHMVKIGVWCALGPIETNGVEIAEYHPSESYNAHIVAYDTSLHEAIFYEASRDFLGDISLESGQWFVADGNVAIAPLPYVKRKHDYIELAVAKDHQWDWEMVRALRCIYPVIPESESSESESEHQVIRNVELYIESISESEYIFSFERVSTSDQVRYRFPFVVNVWCEGNQIKFDARKMNVIVTRYSVSDNYVYIHDEINQHLHSQLWGSSPIGDDWGWQ